MAFVVKALYCHSDRTQRTYQSGETVLAEYFPDGAMATLIERGFIEEVADAPEVPEPTGETTPQDPAEGDTQGSNGETEADTKPRRKK